MLYLKNLWLGGVFSSIKNQSFKSAFSQQLFILQEKIGPYGPELIWHLG